MAKDYVVIKGQANIIRNETAEGGNTAAEVGGAIYDVADKLEEVDGVLTAALGDKLPTSSVVDNLASTSAASPLSANQGKVLNETKADKDTQVVAGNGLTGGGALSGDVTVNVGNTDDSIVVGADGIKVDTQDSLASTSTTKPLSAAQGKALQDNKAENNRTITAGNGLTGGGNLTEDRTIDINPADDSLTVTADNVKVNTNNTLTSTSTTQPLSANQGNVLNEKVVQVETDLNLDEYTIAEAFNLLYRKIVSLETIIANGIFKNIQVDNLTTVNSFNYSGAPLIVIGSTAPSSAPDFVGQTYVNTTAPGTVYSAKGITSVSDWKQTSN